MKKLLILLSTVMIATAGDVNLAWDPSPSPEVNAYRLYCWKTGDTNAITTPATMTITLTNVLSATVSNLALGDWTFTVTALNINPTEELESDMSNAVTTKLRPQGAKLRILR